MDALRLQPLQMRQVGHCLVDQGVWHSVLPKVGSKPVSRNAGHFFDLQHKVGRYVPLAADPLADGTLASADSDGHVTLSLAGLPK